MSAFDKIIGYQGIKDELLQLCDMYANPEVYAKLGASMPQGILLYGEPGLGKTMICKAFIEECGIHAVTVRRNISGEAFVEHIKEAFYEAKEHAPAIVFLDDMDKFANEDENHKNAPEYVAIQACIDDCKDSNIFVLATINDIDNLPDSLLRAGRFDRTIKFISPSGQDAEEIIRYFLSNKKLADDVNFEDITKMISYSSCAELEAIINAAAIRAAYRRSDEIQMNDIVQATLDSQYDVCDHQSSMSETEIRKTAIHEAGHLVALEVLQPEAAGFVSIATTDDDSIGGFVHACEKVKRRPHNAMVSLAGKAATEMYYAYPVASGCDYDIHRAYRDVLNGVSNNATHGLSNITSKYESSDVTERSIETVVNAELEKLYQKTRQLLIDNREFLEKITDALCEKKTLLYSEIQEIKNSCEIKQEVA